MIIRKNSHKHRIKYLTEYEVTSTTSTHESFIKRLFFNGLKKLGLRKTGYVPLKKIELKYELISHEKVK